MRKIDELKLKLKGMAEEIKKKNMKLKEVQKSKGSSSGSYLMFELYQTRYEFRHYHIAYCELRDKTRDQIEKPREYNEANECLIEKIKIEYAWEIPTEALQEAK
jgi:hypothetical protein